jgi:hypothetical protein
MPTRAKGGCIAVSFAATEHGAIRLFKPGIAW